MALPKVYLAKSNRANPNLVSKVRQTLSNFNIQIVEYTGGSYNHNQLMECEQLVVVPDLSNEEFFVGKGLYEQIQKFGSKKGLEYVMVINEDSDGLFVGEISDMWVVDSDDYIQYGELIFGDGVETLFDIFDDIYDLKPTNLIKNNNVNYYHLIGKNF